VCRFATDAHAIVCSTGLIAEIGRRLVSAATGIKRLGLTVAAVIAVGFALLLTSSFLIPADKVREAVKSQIRAVTGLDPILRGDVSVSLFPTGRLSFSDISLGDDSTGAPALSAKQLVVRLRFLPFLTGHIEIADVALIEPRIVIDLKTDGSSNWSSHIETLARALQPSASQVDSFSEIRISNGTIVVRDESDRIAQTLSNVEFALAWPSISSSFGATGRFMWHDEQVDVALSLSDFVAALAGKRSGLKLRLTSAPLKFAFDVYFSHKPTLRMEGMVAADSASLRDALDWAASWSSPGGGFGRFALKAKASVVGHNISLSGVNIQLDGNVGEGVIAFAGDGRRTLQGTLAVDTLDLTPYVSTMRLIAGGEHRWNRRPLTLDDLGELDADLRLSAAKVTIGSARLGRSAVALNLHNANLTVAVGESQAFGGVLQGSFGLARSPAGADLKAQLRFSEVNLEQCLGELLGVRRIEGKGNIMLALTGSGRSVYGLTKALNGSASLVSHKGALAGVNIEQFLRRLERSPLSSRGELRGGRTPYDLLAIKLKVTQGNALVDNVQLEAPSIRVSLAGTASIPARELDLKGTASLLADAGSTSADRPMEASFELPFVVQGPWDDPLAWPDPQSLIRRSGAAAPLLDAVRNRLKRQVPRVLAQPPAESKPAPSPVPTRPTLAGESEPPQ
jgi:AsmA protein